MPANSIKKLGFLITIFVFNVNSFSQNKYPFQDSKLSTEERVNNIVSLMTLDEKVNALSTNPSVPRLGIKGCDHVEGLHGLAMGEPGGWGGKSPIPTTIFPQSYGLGETWDTSVLRLVGQTEGYDVRYVYQRYKRGALVVRAPNADLGRDPRWGRTEECYGEDPFLNGSLAVAFIKGMQGNDPVYWQAASLMKHFLANSNENSRTQSSSNFDERLWREYYSVPFRMGIQLGGSNAYMASYNKINGVPSTVHSMHKNISMKEWGLNGIVCTDGGAYGLLITDHKYYPDYAHAAEACIKAGINQFLDRHKEGVYSALANGLLKEADLDSVLNGNYRIMIKLGLLDNPESVPYSKIGIKDTIDPWSTTKNKEIVCLVTQKSIVLLKNDKNILPIDRKKIKKIAVIGPRANEVLLDWYSGTPPYTVTALQGIKNKLGSEVQVFYQKNNNSDSAVNIARQADFAIVCVGNHPTGNAGWAQCPVASDGKEAVDRLSISMEQEDLVKQIVKVNPNTIVVLISSFPFAINWTKENAPAILHMANNSQELGNALADVIFGDYNPAGRLNQTWPASIDDLPDMLDYNIRNGRTYMYSKAQPLFPFGYGLSYTSFAYSALEIDKEPASIKDEIIVSATIKNKGNCDGDEVVQLYVKHIDSKVERAEKELKGFSRVFIKKGETKKVSILVKASDLAYWDEKFQSYIFEKDKIKFMLGASSADIRLEKELSLVK